MILIYWNTQQNTIAEKETVLYESYFQSVARLNSIIVESKENGKNVLTKESLVDAMKMHLKIETSKVDITDEETEKTETYQLSNLCMMGRETCASVPSGGVCDCFVTGILKQWDYNLDTLVNDDDFMTTLNGYGNSIDDLTSVLGDPVLDDSGEKVVSASAFTISYFLIDRTEEAGSDEEGTESDPINEGWEEKVFLDTVQSDDYPSISVNYFAGRSFSDEFAGAITGDLLLVQISYAVVFIFLGANLGTLISISCSNQSLFELPLMQSTL